jgi:hypothetical protein
MRLGLVQGKAVEKAIVELTLSERNESKGLDFNFNNLLITLGLVQGKALKKVLVELTLSERNESKGLWFNYLQLLVENISRTCPGFYTTQCR